MTSLCRVRIHLDHLRHNVALLRASGKPLMPVVKADAYGHGLAEIAAVLRGEGIGHLAVGTVGEGAALRRGGFDGVIVALLGAVSDEDMVAARTYGIVPLVHEWSGLIRLAGCCEEGEPVRVAVKCDTGMARLGFSVEEMPQVAEFLAGSAGLRPVMLVSHLAVADTPKGDDFTVEQARRFGAAARALRRHFPDMLLSLGNTACLLAFPELVGDLARPGLALYGGNPLHGTARAILGEGLEPVMEVSAPVLSVHPLPAGESLGYGRTYVAASDRLVAVVGIGYADGYRRGPAPGACMTLHGQRAPVIGRVAMQMTCLDVTDLPDVKPGDEAWVLGGEGDAVSIQDLADWWGTIPYEVTCLLGKNRRT